MRLTVGPLPPAVYWRRRAMVLGVVLLFVLVIVYSCSNQDGKPAASPKNTASPTPTATELPSADPTDEAPVDPVGQIEPSESSAPPQPALGSECTDDEIRVTPIPSHTSVQRGVTIEIRLKIKNVSSRTCDRDVGADAQEVYISAGAQKIWSSDTCGAAHGSKVVSIPPNIEHEYRVAWNGKLDTRCTNDVADGDYPQPGEYQVFGRLGTKHSDPVTLAITG